MRSKLQRLHYLREREVAIRIQSHVRTWLARRDRAARVIQRAARVWLGDAVTRKQNRAAVKIQVLQYLYDFFFQDLWPGFKMFMDFSE